MTEVHIEMTELRTDQSGKLGKIVQKMLSLLPDVVT